MKIPFLPIYIIKKRDISDMDVIIKKETDNGAPLLSGDMYIARIFWNLVTNNNGESIRSRFLMNKLL